MITVNATIPVQLDFDQTARVTYFELKQCRDCFIEELTHDEPNIFVFGDVEADKIEIQKHIDALDLIIEWYHDPTVEKN